MKHTLSRRALSLLLCFSLVLGCAAYRPQKASAVVTETAIALGLASLIPYAISTGMDLSATSGGADAIATGISELWDSFYARWQETDTTIKRSAEDELAYIGGQIMPTYKNSVLTLSDYVVGVYDKFVQWLIGEKGVTEGGDAVEVANILGGVTFSSCTSNYTLTEMRVLRAMAISYAEETTSLVHSLGIGEKALVLSMNKEVFRGYFFNDDGIFCLGVFKNPYESVNASFFGIYEMDSLELLAAGNVYYSTDSYVSSTSYDRLIFYDRSFAEAWTGFLLGSCVVLNFSVPFVKSNAGTCLDFYCYTKESTNSTLSDSGTYKFSFSVGSGSSYVYSNGESYDTSDMYFADGCTFDNSTLSAENEDYTAPALPTGKAMQINLNFRAGAADDADELPAAIYSAAADPTDSATGWELSYDVVDAADEGTTTEPDEEAGNTEETDKFLPSILDSIKALPGQIAEKIKDLFVPDEDYAAEFVAELNSTYDGRMGLLTYPFSVLADFAQTVATLEEQEPVLRWNAVTWQGETIIAAGEYNLRSAVTDAQMQSIYSIYRTVISGVLVIGFLQLCLKKLKEVQQN